MSAIKEVYNLLWYSTSKKDRKLANRFYEEVSALERRIKELEAAQQSVQADKVCTDPAHVDFTVDRMTGIAYCKECGKPCR